MTPIERANRVMPGGVNSPVRAFRAVGGDPPFAVSGTGGTVTLADGREVIDFISSWGALLFGHAFPPIVDAVQRAAADGTSFGIPTIAEVELAEKIVEMTPSVEVVRMVNSGTEATASALRLARAATGRPGVVKFAGSYHGHADPFLVDAGSGLATFGVPSSPGVPEGTVADTLIARYNDLPSVEFHLSTGTVAAVIVEPVAGNMGCIPPADGFLAGLRRLCDEHGTLLIFDEVMTGFRVAADSAQGRYGITPDLTTLGKVVAGGTPAAAYGGREPLMRMIAPDGPVYQAGTLAGNPLATAAGLASLTAIQERPSLYDRFDEAGDKVADRLLSTMRDVGLPGAVTHVGGMIGVFLGVENVSTWDDVAGLDGDLYARFFHASLERGVLLPPSPYETWFLMESHLDGLLDRALDVFETAIREAVS